MAVTAEVGPTVAEVVAVAMRGPEAATTAGARRPMAASRRRLPAALATGEVLAAAGTASAPTPEIATVDEVVAALVPAAAVAAEGGRPRLTSRLGPRRPWLLPHTAAVHGSRGLLMGDRGRRGRGGEGFLQSFCYERTTPWPSLRPLKCVCDRNCTRSSLRLSGYIGRGAPA